MFKRFLDWLKSLFKRSNPVLATPVPTQPEKSPVEPVLKPQTPISGAKPDSSYAPEGSDNITDRLFRPNAETGAILDGRVGHDNQAQFPLMPIPSVLEKAYERRRCFIMKNSSHQIQLNGLGFVVSPTANDPAGQGAWYSASVVGIDGSVTGLGRSPKTFYVQASQGKAILSSDQDSEIWFETRPN